MASGSGPCLPSSGGSEPSRLRQNPFPRRRPNSYLAEDAASGGATGGPLAETRLGGALHDPDRACCREMAGAAAMIGQIVGIAVYAFALGLGCCLLLRVARRHGLLAPVLVGA